MLAVIDYGAGNLRSVLHALRTLGAGDLHIVQDGDALREATRIILPGVGAFGAGMQQLREKGFVEPLGAAVRAGTPCLGICLGMQFLFERSDEMGEHAGLGLLPGHVTRFAPAARRKVPHMGWNRLLLRRPSPCWQGLTRTARSISCTAIAACRNVRRMSSPARPTARCSSPPYNAACCSACSSTRRRASASACSCCTTSWSWLHDHLPGAGFARRQGGAPA